eukprot:365602-Chlamydomonas_euryale.AAC.3
MRGCGCGRRTKSSQVATAAAGRSDVGNRSRRVCCCADGRATHSAVELVMGMSHSEPPMTRGACNRA